MADPLIHSTSWTGDIGAPPTPPRSRGLQPLSRTATIGGAASIAWILGATLLFASTRLARWIIPAIPIAEPPIWTFSFTAVAAFVLLKQSMSRELSRITVQVSLFAAAVSVALALLLPALTVYSYLHAQHGRLVRAQLVSPKHDGQGAILAFQDGSSVEASLFWQSQRYYHRRGECFAVRRYSGPFGYSWLKVLETTPPPQNSELWWTIRTEDCFSNKPLSTLGR